MTPRRPVRGRTSAVAALSAAIALVGGCAWDGPMSTVVARSDLNRSILSVYSIITWACAIIAVVAALFACARKRLGKDSPRLPISPT